MTRYLMYAVLWGGLMACGGSETAISPLLGQAVTGHLEASPLDIQCGGSTTVQVRLIAGTSTMGRPADVVLVLDRSGSMAGSMGSLKAATKSFVDMLDQGTDGVLDGMLGNGNRIGIVSFSSGATLDRPLTANATQAKAAIDGLVAAGSTNHSAGISTAQDHLAPTPNGHIMIIFTDGNTTAGPNPFDEAAEARAAGTEIFGIGLGGGINQNAVRSWVTEPVDSHAYFTTDPGTLQQIFETIGARLIAPAATNVQVMLANTGRFIVSNAAASKGSLSASQGVLNWSMDELMSETVTLTYTVTHDNQTRGGSIPLLASSSYSDAEGNVVVFANPSINVHGCAVQLDLTPEHDSHMVGELHTLTARIIDDFGDPVPGISVSLSVTGGVSVVDGEPSSPTPSAGSGITDANGEVPFVYSNNQATTDVITAVAPVQPNVAQILMDTAQHTWLAIPVVIDIKPGSDPSSFGAKSKGNIPVALFGASGFDVTQIDDGTVRFGDAPTPLGDAAATGNGSVSAVNNDGFLDRVYHFYFPDTHLDPSDGYGCIGGEINGLDFMGCSDVRIVPDQE
jgi:hypothetical protein